MGKTKLNIPWTPTLVPSELMREIVLAIQEGSMTGTTGKTVLKHVLSASASTAGPVAGSRTSNDRDRPHSQSQSLLAVLDDLGLSSTLSNSSSTSSSSSSNSTSSSSPSAELEAFCAQAITNQPKAVDDYKRGNEKVIMRLVGEVMKISKGSADAKKARMVLEERLK
ncbi:hypothetical protein I317_07840 [Kwoniella heveanensis CBS 569]|nr:hypothetical protein I317_07840 [Kwoniella heveanensis CBS 569]